MFNQFNRPQQPQQNTGFNMMNQQFQQPQQQQQTQMGFNQPYLQQNQQQHLNQVREILNRVHILQNSPQLSQLLQLLQIQQTNAMNEITKTMDQTDITTANLAQIESTNNRIIKIKNKNSLLMKKLLLVKGKLQKLNYHKLDRNQQLENQNQQIMNKIKHLKSQITIKCAHLKSLKINRNQQRLDQAPKTQSYLIMGSKLNQLIKGTECLNKQVLKVNTQIDIVTKYIHEKKF